MKTYIKNGGIALGFMEAVGYENLSDADKKVYDALSALPKGISVQIDKDNKPVQDEYDENKASYDLALKALKGQSNSSF